MVEQSYDISDSQQRTESTPLYPIHSDKRTLRCILLFFFVFSVAVTLALAVQYQIGGKEVVVHGGVSSDDQMCSNIGISVLEKGGNAVDAAIATTFCLSVVNPHMTGIGGGGIMMIYDQRERDIVDVIDFRVGKSINDTIGVPGFVAGLYLAHKKHGYLEWSDLLNPAINVAKVGFKVSEGLFESQKLLGPNERNLHLSKGDFISVPELAQTLLSISNSPEKFYQTVLREELSHFLDERDILSYEAVSVPGYKFPFRNFDVVVPGNGSGGPALDEGFAGLDGSLPRLLSVANSFQELSTKWQKTSYGSQVSTMDVNDLYVSVVSGLGSVLGSKHLLDSGYMLNDALSLRAPDSDGNSKRGGDRQLTLSVPVIAVEKGNVCGSRFVSGAGDARDLAQLLLQLLENADSPLEEAVEEPRIRVGKGTVAWENGPDLAAGISEEDKEMLAKAGYEVFEVSPPYPSLNVIRKVGDNITAYADSRGYGGAAII